MMISILNVDNFHTVYILITSQFIVVMWKYSMFLFLKQMSKEIQSHILSTFQIKSFLGSGAYGHVWKVAHRQTGREYALKKIFDAFQNDVDAQRTYRQVTILHQLQHLNIIKLQWVIKANNARDLYLVFEFMETDLHSVIGQNILGAPHIRFIAYQLCKVLKYLHSAQLIHRDLKSSNILLNSNCEIKLCDFGLVRSMVHEEQTPIILSQDVATRWYRSPEMLLGSQSYGKSTDMWSLGCVLAELVKGEPLFPGSSNLEQIQKILQFTGNPDKQAIKSMDIDGGQAFINKLRIKKKPLKILIGDCDNQIKEMILRMLQFDPSKRISAQQALQLPCLQQFRGKSVQNTCNKFIITELDDNRRLSLEQYRTFIYRDIERRYPTLNKITPMPRIYRSYHSVNGRINPESITKKPSNSLFKIESTASNNNSLHKNWPQASPIAHNPIHKFYRKQYKKMQQCEGKQNIKDMSKTFITNTEPQDTSSKIFKRKIRRNLWGKQQ